MQSDIQTICDERDDIQNELERLRRELTKTTQQLEGINFIGIWRNSSFLFPLCLSSVETRERAEIEELLANERGQFNTTKQELSDRILMLEGNQVIYSRQTRLVKLSLCLGNHCG